MEHRCSLRVSTNINVLIFKSEIPIAFGRVVNSSKLGFFIETNFSDVNVDQSLDIELLPAGNEKNLCRYIYSVRVIRKTPHGLGVEIEDTKAESNLSSSYYLVANF
jgi:hypothetical protein